MSEYKMYCKKCKNIKLSRYCDVCKKDTVTKHELICCDKISLQDSVSGKQKRPSLSGFLRKFFFGYQSSNDKKYSKGVTRNMDIDKKSDWYDETVIDNNTQEIIRDCHEPLSQHQGRGSAKFKK